MKKIVIAIQIVLVIAVTAFGIQSVQNTNLLLQKRIVTVLYEENPEVCATVIEKMFRNTDEADFATEAENIMMKLGYTKQGVELLNYENGLSKAYVGTYALQFTSIILCSLIFSSIVNKKAKDEIHYQVSKINKTLQACKKELEECKKVTQNFIENIAHQIKTPLACASLSLEMMEGKNDDVEQTLIYLKQIEILMKMLLDIGRLESGKLLMKKEEIQMETLLEECRQLLDPKGEKVLFEINSCAEDKSLFYGDYEWLKEAIMNILKNCMEHNDDNELIQIVLEQTPNAIGVQVRDHGPGIEEADIEHIFDRFYISRNSKKSHTGIGLNLSDLVVQKHFGKIKAYNHVDGGAVFEIRLPLHELKQEKIRFI